MSQRCGELQNQLELTKQSQVEHTKFLDQKMIEIQVYSVASVVMSLIPFATVPIPVSIFATVPIPVSIQQSTGT